MSDYDDSLYDVITEVIKKQQMDLIEQEILIKEQKNLVEKQLKNLIFFEKREEK